MPIKTVRRTNIEHVPILDARGDFDEEFGWGLIPDEGVVRLYEHMNVSRHFDQITLNLHRSVGMGTTDQDHRGVTGVAR